ncbi:hypothetical protein PYH37_003572 [Sinorhizobium numidicum]|uniref:Uncharacterized protein n=1 Tax=Sinorhizobium numidicum TaxID=680248 RepID=A0ABY8CV80_9HYPH|nr:hypothetical protein [Sinorhizobium numidicum]WEX78660.1 hypothetical protein PYH37_003572 [Sinorhizobium numidicum]WEX82057.1 hypothetical protein PYH38_004285 [Sinorhizobium numidicum]
MNEIDFAKLFHQKSSGISYTRLRLPHMARKFKHQHRFPTNRSGYLLSARIVSKIGLISDYPVRILLKSISLLPARHKSLPERKRPPSPRNTPAAGDMNSTAVRNRCLPVALNRNRKQF